MHGARTVRTARIRTNTNRPMKKLLLLLAALCGTLGMSAQTPEIAEPDFIGEVITIRPDGTTEKLEKETVQLRTRANAGALIIGIGKAKTKMIVESPAAAVRLNGDDEITFIVKAVDNATDPISIINVFRFETNKKRRLAEVASASTFGSVKSGKLERLRFDARKYGESSYLLTLRDKPAGEFGITVSNPNHVDEKQMIVSTFAIEGPEAAATEEAEE